jgi:hypothetical protein
MDKEQLQALRGKILEDIVPLALDSATNEADRFALLLRLIQAGNASSEIYTKAYESAKAIPDRDEQLNCLMSLLDEIDLSVIDTKQPAEAPRKEASQQSQPAPQEQPAPQPVQQDNFGQ